MTIEFLKEIVDNEELSLDALVTIHKPWTVNMRLFPHKVEEYDDYILLHCTDGYNHDTRITIEDLLKYNNNKPLAYTTGKEMLGCKIEYIESFNLHRNLKRKIELILDSRNSSKDYNG